MLVYRAVGLFVKKNRKKASAPQQHKASAVRSRQDANPFRRSCAAFTYITASQKFVGERIAFCKGDPRLTGGGPHRHRVGGDKNCNLGKNVQPIKFCNIYLGSNPHGVLFKNQKDPKYTPGLTHLSKDPRFIRRLFCRKQIGPMRWWASY